MDELFRDSNFNGDISSWDVSSVTNMSGMFSHTDSFNQAIGNWNVGSATDMSRMFEHAESFNQDISGWCVELIDSEHLRFQRVVRFKTVITRIGVRVRRSKL